MGGAPCSVDRFEICVEQTNIQTDKQTQVITIISHTYAVRLIKAPLKVHNLYIP